MKWLTVVQLVVDPWRLFPISRSLLSYFQGLELTIWVRSLWSDTLLPRPKWKSEFSNTILERFYSRTFSCALFSQHLKIKTCIQKTCNSSSRIRIEQRCPYRCMFHFRQNLFACRPYVFYIWQAVLFGPEKWHHLLCPLIKWLKPWNQGKVDTLAPRGC